MTALPDTVYCFAMPTVPTAIPDGPKIRELIWKRGYSVRGFARKIGRPEDSVSGIVGGRWERASITYLRQIARGLRVKVSDISDWTGDDDIEPEPKALASLDANKAPRCTGGPERDTSRFTE